MKRIFKRIKSVFIKEPKMIYGPKIFESKSWMDKQVEDAMYKRAFGLDQ